MDDGKAKGGSGGEKGWEGHQSLQTSYPRMGVVVFVDVDESVFPSKPQQERTVTKRNTERRESREVIVGRKALR